MENFNLWDGGLMPGGVPPLPQKPIRDRSVLEWAKGIERWIRKSRPVAGSGLSGRQTDGGYIISLTSSEDQLSDFEIHAAGTSYKVSGGNVYDIAGTSNPVVVPEAVGSFTGTTYAYLDLTVGSVSGSDLFCHYTVTSGTVVISSSATYQTDTTSGELPGDATGRRIYTLGTITEGTDWTTVEQDLKGPAWFESQTALQEGAEGDIIYNNGTNWTTLAKPSSFTYDPILRYGTAGLYWDEPSNCA